MVVIEIFTFDSRIWTHKCVKRHIKSLEHMLYFNEYDMMGRYRGICDPHDGSSKLCMGGHQYGINNFMYKSMSSGHTPRIRE